MTKIEVPQNADGSNINANWRVQLSIVWKNMKDLFAGSILRPMVLMLYINFAIQFGFVKSRAR